MKKAIFGMLLVALLGVFATDLALAQDDMKKDKDKAEKSMSKGMETKKGTTIVDVAAGNSNFSTLVTAVQAAGLAETLSGTGPFTVFAPTNDAFAKLPAGTVEDLVKPENKATLSKILTYHVVAGKVSAKSLIKMIKKGKGTATLKTVSGGNLTAKLQGDKVVLTDEKGGTSTITMTDVKASNGYIHAIDTVVMPN